MDYNEMARLFREFEKYDKNNRTPATDKLERFYEYVTQRIRVLDALAQIINHRTGKHVDITLVTSIDDIITEKLDKMVRYYFKTEQANPAVTQLRIHRKGETRK